MTRATDYADECLVPSFTENPLLRSMRPKCSWSIVAPRYRLEVCCSLFFIGLVAAVVHGSSEQRVEFTTLEEPQVLEL